MPPSKLKIITKPFCINAKKHHRRICDANLSLCYAFFYVQFFGGTAPQIGVHKRKANITANECSPLSMRAMKFAPFIVLITLIFFTVISPPF